MRLINILEKSELIGGGSNSDVEWGEKNQVLIFSMEFFQEIRTGVDYRT